MNVRSRTREQPRSVGTVRARADLARRVKPRRAPARPPRRRIRLLKRAGGQVYQSRQRAGALPLNVVVGEDWGAIARLYDLEHPTCRGAELAFWRRAATEAYREAKAAAGRDTEADAGTEIKSDAAGDVLELATGSGRVALALARHGHRVTGLELSEGMLARARARTQRLPPEMQARLCWVQGNMAAFDLPGRRFSLVFVAYNSFWLLTDAAAQARALRCIARHLTPRGRLIVDVFPPNEDDYRDEPAIAQRLALPYRGRSVLRLKDYVFAASQQQAISDVRYYAEDPETGNPADLLARFRYILRLSPPAEVQALLESQGYVVEAVYGSYQHHPLTVISPRAIFIAHLSRPLLDA